MGYAMVIKGADFSANKVTTIDIDTDIDLDKYIDTEYTNESEFVKVLTDNVGRILYGKRDDGTIVDYSSAVSGMTVEDGTSVVKIINKYKETI